MNILIRHYLETRPNLMTLSYIQRISLVALKFYTTHLSKDLLQKMIASKKYSILSLNLRMNRASMI